MKIYSMIFFHSALIEQYTDTYLVVKESLSALGHVRPVFDSDMFSNDNFHIENMFCTSHPEI